MTWEGPDALESWTVTWRPLGLAKPVISHRCQGCCWFREGVDQPPEKHGLLKLPPGKAVHKDVSRGEAHGDPEADGH